MAANRLIGSLSQQVTHVAVTLNPDAIDQAAMSAMQRQAANRQVASAVISEMLDDVSCRTEKILEVTVESLNSSLPSEFDNALTCSAEYPADSEDDSGTPCKAASRTADSKSVEGIPSVIKKRVSDLLRDDDPRHVANREAAKVWSH